MKIFESILTEHNAVRIRVRANSPEEAEAIKNEFSRKESDYLAEELDLNGEKQWVWTDFMECHAPSWDEAATITKNEDGSFDAQYEGGYND